MITCDAAREIIKTHEGLSLKAYTCPAGKLTIGYGHTRGVRPGQVITRDDAEDLLQEDLERFEAAVARLAPGANANEFGAMVSLCFNIGEKNFTTSTVLRRFKAGDKAGAAAAFALWGRAHVNGELQTLPGLVKRRAAEKALFLTQPS